MITVQLTGGLGNQMFQYACGITTARRLHTSLDFYHLNTEEETKRKLELTVFNGVIRKHTNQNHYILNKIVTTQNFVTKNFSLQLPILPRIYIEKTLNFDNNIYLVQDNTILIGYWQSEKYFTQDSKNIRRMFSFKKEDNQLNKKIEHEIKNTNSVSLHIRRGDYVSRAAARSFHGSPALAYYKKAIELINKNIENPVFYIFSDDIAWVKKNVHIPLAQYVINNNDQAHAYKDMKLMSLCKHNIIANSTFSWWGAWLNTNAKKIVVAPKKWFAKDTVELADRFPRSWIIM